MCGSRASPGGDLGVIRSPGLFQVPRFDASGRGGRVVLGCVFGVNLRVEFAHVISFVIVVCHACIVSSERVIVK